jgi:hypothetical protein
VGLAHEELDRAALRVGEDDELASKLARLRHAGKLTQALARARDALDGGALSGVAEAERALREAAQVDPALAALAEELATARLTLDETLRAVESALDPESLDPAEAEAAEARHALLERLVRRHHRTLPELIAYRDELAARLARVEGARTPSARALPRPRRWRAARSTRRPARSAADGARPRSGSNRRWRRELGALGLAQAKLTIAFEPLDPPGPARRARRALFAPNPGEAARPLAKIASGRELRVMLALETLLAEADGVAALLFDEVDAGIGGAVARAVGERPAALARVRQVLCVTHLPVIAAQAGSFWHLRGRGRQPHGRNAGSRSRATRASRRSRACSPATSCRKRRAARRASCSRARRRAAAARAAQEGARVNLPAVFVSHGAPTLALESHDPTHVFLQGLGKLLGKPRGIVCASAHWEAAQTALTAAAAPSTIHDFYGSDALYRIRYGARRSRTAARAGLLAGAGMGARSTTAAASARDGCRCRSPGRTPTCRDPALRPERARRRAPRRARPRSRRCAPGAS